MIQIPKAVYDTCEEERVLLPAGRYLVRIEDAEEKDAGEHVLVKYRTISPHVPGTHEERFYLSEKALKRFSALCKRAGLVDRGTDPTDSLMLDPFDLGGTQLVVDVIQEESEKTPGKFFSKWDYMGFWSPADPRVGDFVRSLGQAQRRPAVQAQPVAPNGRHEAPPLNTDDEV